MSGPISPSEVVAAKQDAIPDAVFNVWNRLIGEAWTGSYATVKQKAVVSALCSAMGVESSEVFSRGWLEIEPVYRNAGWKVKYDKPGFNETYDATFEFRK